MEFAISQSEASDLFGIPSKILYVCDGKKDCSKPSCLDHSDMQACHHTADPSHALYETHDMRLFASYPSVRGDKAATILVEPIRG